MITFLIKAYRPLGLVILAFACFGFTPKAHAILSSSAPVGWGMIVQGCCDKACAFTAGRIATSWETQIAFGWISATLNPQIMKVGQAYKSGEQKISAVINKRFEAQNATLHSLFVGYGYGQEKSNNAKLFGSQSAAFAGWNRENYLAGQKAEQSFDVRLRHQAKAYAEEFENSNQVATRLFQVDAEDINPRCVFPTSGTLTKEQGEDLLIVMNTITDAFPATEVPESFNAAAYRSIVKARRLRAQIAEAVLAEVMAGYAPTVEVDEKARQMWQAAGGDGDPARMENGSMSPVGYLGFLIRSRFASAGFTNIVHAKPTAGILRELTSVSALRLAIEQRQLRRSQQIALMVALQVSGKSGVQSLELNEALYKVLED